MVLELKLALEPSSKSFAWHNQSSLNPRSSLGSQRSFPCSSGDRRARYADVRERLCDGCLSCLFCYESHGNWETDIRESQAPGHHAKHCLRPPLPAARSSKQHAPSVPMSKETGSVAVMEAKEKVPEVCEVAGAQTWAMLLSPDCALRPIDAKT